jgi:hypothetical protein
MKIDERLPEYQVSVRYSILVGSYAEKVGAALRKASFADLPIVRGPGAIGWEKQSPRHRHRRKAFASVLF